MSERKHMLVLCVIDMEFDYEPENYPGQSADEAAAGCVEHYEELLDGVNQIVVHDVIERQQSPLEAMLGNDAGGEQQQDDSSSPAAATRYTVERFSGSLLGVYDQQAREFVKHPSSGRRHLFRLRGNADAFAADLNAGQGKARP